MLWGLSSPLELFGLTTNELEMSQWTVLIFLSLFLLIGMTLLSLMRNDRLHGRCLAGMGDGWLDCRWVVKKWVAVKVLRMHVSCWNHKWTQRALGQLLRQLVLLGSLLCFIFVCSSCCHYLQPFILCLFSSTSEQNVRHTHPTTRRDYNMGDQKGVQSLSNYRLPLIGLYCVN